MGDKKKGATLVVGGDGRYLCPETVNIIIQMAAANGVHSFIIYFSEKNSKKVGTNVECISWRR